MTNKEYCYVLSKYEFYDASWIIMISLSYDEVTTMFTRKFRQLEDGQGLVIKRYEFGKEYSFSKGEPICWIEKDYDGKIKDLMEV